MHGSGTAFEYSRITPSIYIGTNRCCITHFEKELLKKGVRADISLDDKIIDHPFGASYYLWIPTRDHYAPTLQQLLTGVIFIKNLVSMKIKLYVHCEKGHTRAPTLVAAYFIFLGENVEDAIAAIKEKRSAIHITRQQKKALYAFARYIRKHRLTSL